MRVNKLLSVLLALLLVFGLGAQAWAGNPEKKGTAGAEELLIPMGARGTALAGSAVAMINGVDAMYWNPAGLANTNNNVEATFSYLKYIADINVNYAAVGVKTGLGTLGFSFQNLAFGDIAVTTEDAPDGTGAYYSPTYMTLAAVYSRAMTDRIYIGVAAKLVNEKIMNTSGSAVAFDMGVQYLTGYGVKLGVTLKNFGSPMKYDGQDLDRTVQVPGTPEGSPDRLLRIPSQKAELPSMFEIALAYDFKPMEKLGVSLMVNMRNQNFLNDQILGGVEVNWANQVFLRGGYDYGMNEKSEDIPGGNATYQFGPTFGFGLMQPISGNMKVGFDFAYRLLTTDYFSNNMYFTAKLIF